MVGILQVAPYKLHTTPFVAPVNNCNLLQSNSIIVENSKIVDDLVATKDFYLIKIHNSRNSKIVELFLERLREI